MIAVLYIYLPFSDSIPAMIYFKHFLLIVALTIFLSLCAQININIYEIAITGQTFAVGLIATMFNKKISFGVVFFYIFLGAVGFSVFSNASGGYSVLFAKTGGYIFGFIFYVLFLHIIMNKNRLSYTYAFLGNFIGTIATLIFGCIWLMCYLDKSLFVILKIGLYPFIIPGFIKICLSTLFGIYLKKILIKIFDRKYFFV